MDNAHSRPSPAQRSSFRQPQFLTPDDYPRFRVRCPVVHETSENTNALELGYSQATFERIRDQFPEIDFQWDHASKSIHELLLPDDMDQGDLIRFPVITASGAARPIGEQSHILRRVPRRFQIARIFGDFSGTDEHTRDRVRQAAAEEYHRLGGRP